MPMILHHGINIPAVFFPTTGIFFRKGTYTRNEGTSFHKSFIKITSALKILTFLVSTEGRHSLVLTKKLI